MKHALLALVLLAAAPPQESTRIAGDATQPHLVAGKDGAFYCAFIRGGNIELSTSADGTAWSTPVVAIDGKGKASGGCQRGPRVGVDDSGNVHVTAPLNFDPAEETEKFPRRELWIASSADGGKTFAKPVQVNDVAKKAAESLHAMAVAPAGDVHVTWLDNRSQERGNDLYYVKCSGGKMGKSLRLAALICDCCAPAIALDDGGNPVVSYREGGKKASREIMMAVSRDGGKAFGAPVQVNRTKTKIDT